ncbi:hypothetical protein C7999DRAFT_42684 [Corynascus novoguineensis]|uniref:Uncharacterized protein n=1 Tax=Corynascus novoguineensis TaxID=1126955 RepID=A0AAN7CPW6_9PEZI|nr:hypothetical protein C7999DRAFT_42684 [Corynascus novoguineensis]
MNWTEANRHRRNRGRMRKVNPDHQRQKEYFARARARTAEREAAEENGSPPISFFQYPDPPSSQCSHASIRSGSSSGRRTLFIPGGHRFESSRKRDKAVTKTGDVPLPTISRFFQEQSGGQTLLNPQVEYDQETLERMRQKLLAKKD